MDSDEVQKPCEVFVEGYGLAYKCLSMFEAMGWAVSYWRRIGAEGEIWLGLDGFKLHRLA